jgi:cytochrome b6-f complex iron-sulfur subunit
MTGRTFHEGSEKTLWRPKPSVVKQPEATIPALARRRFLALVGGAAASTACVMETGPGQQVAQDVAAGKASDLMQGTLKAVADAACIGRDDNGVYALSLICTHAGCDISQNGSVSGQGIFCNCHGSAFDPLGNVLGGPARQPLPHFRVSADANGNLTIHVGQVVSATQRLSA